MFSLHISKAKPNTRVYVSALYDWVEAAVFSLICVVVVFTFFFRIVGVDGKSMMDTLMHKDRLILASAFYTPKHGDIVVINRYAEEPLIKRVIAMGGDELQIDPDTHIVLLNGEELDEPYVHYDTVLEDFRGPITIPEGYVFVMGDNRWHSSDSRSSIIGLVDTRRILGHALMRLTPFDKMGAVD